VPVSEECKKFINDCLKKNSKDRPTTAQLLSHEWFEGLYQNQVSKLRQKAIKDSLQDETDMFEKEAVRLCDIMLFGVFEEHLKKIGQTMLLNSEVIKRTTTIFEKYYAGDRKFLEYYFMLILKKLDSLEQREVIYMIYDQSFKIKVKDMEKYQEFQREVFSLVKNEMPDLNAGKFEKVNFEREIIKFCISETELLMDSSKDEEITEKMYLLKNWCKFATVEYENTMIEIQWGERKDYEKYQEYVAKYLIGVNEEVISRTINQQPQSD
jgi:serine/threonine protein kinase